MARAVASGSLKSVSNLKREVGVMRKSAGCVARLRWLTCRTVVVRDPGPSDPDIIPVREPEPDTPDPKPGDEPERIDPVRTVSNSMLALEGCSDPS
jgi:hypothetical protein